MTSFSDTIDIIPVDDLAWESASGSSAIFLTNFAHNILIFYGFNTVIYPYSFGLLHWHWIGPVYMIQTFTNPTVLNMWEQF